MSEVPPPFANYPRNAGSHGSADALRSLADGYFGLSRVFGINIVVAIALNLGIRAGVITGPLAIVLWLGVGVLVAFLTYAPNKKIGAGAGWSPAQPVIASILMGINSALCCGIVGFVVMQTIASNHIKRYGIKAGFFGLKKPLVEARIAELQAQEGSRPI